MQDGVEVATGYASRQLRLGEEKYPPIQKECFAVVWGIRFIHQYLYGQPNFDVITDHCPPKFLMFGRQLKLPPSVEFQPPAPQYSNDFLTIRLNNLCTACALVRKLNKTEKDRQGSS